MFKIIRTWKHHLAKVNILQITDNHILIRAILLIHTMFKVEMLNFKIAIMTKNNLWFTNFFTKMMESSSSQHCQGFQLPYPMERGFSISTWGKMRIPLKKSRSMNHVQSSNLVTLIFKVFPQPSIYFNKNKWKSEKTNKILSKTPTLPKLFKHLWWWRRYDRFSRRMTTPIFNQYYSYCNKSTIKIKEWNKTLNKMFKIMKSFQQKDKFLVKHH